MISSVANHLWQSTAFVAAATLLAYVLRNNRASVRYWIWMAASLKFLLPFAVLVGIGGRVPIPPPVRTAAAPLRMAAGIEHVTQTWIMPASTAANPLPSILPIVWACGVLLVLGGWAQRWRRVRSSPRLEPGVFGIFRPKLILPEGIADRLTPAQLQAVIAHELCHIRRRDNLFAAIHMVVEAIFWFHPIVWWIGARLIEERERACDEEVLRQGSAPEAYAESILVTCQLFLESPVACVSGVTGADLKQRIERIMRHPVGGNLNFTRKALLAIAATAAIAGPLAIGLLHAQAPAFEVVSIKPTPPGTEGGMLRMLGAGGLYGTNVPLLLLVKFAYRVQENQLSGVVPWMKSVAYDIEAKGGESGVDQMRLKMRSMLADRFHLKLHTETKELPMFALVTAKGGLKMQPVQRESGAEDGTFRSGRGRVVASAASLAEFARVLSDISGRPVADRTGVSGNFDFTLLWTPENYKPPTEGDPRPANEPLPDVNGPSLFTALQEQLGLRLEATKGPVDIYVIDSAQKPSEN
jgi:bla regulator protein BlaR1